MRYAPQACGGRTRDEFIAALRAEGSEPCSPGYVPLTRSAAIRRGLAEIYRQRPSPWPAAADGLPILPAWPNAEHAAQHTIWLFQFVLLGDESDMDSIVEAMVKIQRAWGG